MFHETKQKRRKLNNNIDSTSCNVYINKTNKKMYNLNEAFKNMTFYTYLRTHKNHIFIHTH